MISLEGAGLHLLLILTLLDRIKDWPELDSIGEVITIDGFQLYIIERALLAGPSPFVSSSDENDHKDSEIIILQTDNKEDKVDCLRARLQLKEKEKDDVLKVLLPKKDLPQWQRWVSSPDKYGLQPISVCQ